MSDPATPDTPDTPTGADETPVELQDPTTKTHSDQTDGQHEDGGKNAIWVRLLHIIILGLGFWIAEALLGLFTLLQFGWMLFTKEKNMRIAEAGDSIATWLSATVRFLTGASDDKPFPFSDLR